MNKQKSLSILKEIDEALSQGNFRSNSKAIATFENFEEFSQKTAENVKKTPEIHAQINNSFKTLSLQTLNALTSLKNELRNSTDSLKKLKENSENREVPNKSRENRNKSPENLNKSREIINKTPEVLKKSRENRESSLETRKKLKKSPSNLNNIGKSPSILNKSQSSLKKTNKTVEVIDNKPLKINKTKTLRSSQLLEELLVSVREKTQVFKENCADISAKIDNLLRNMQGIPQEKSEALYYTFQKSRTEPFSQRYTTNFSTNCE